LFDLVTLVNGHPPELCVKGPCNLDCLFCRHREAAPAVDLDEHLSDLTGAVDDLARQGHTELAWGRYWYEPTMFPHLAKAIRHARDMGIRKNMLITNGVRTSDTAYLEDLVRNGVTGISMSVYEYDVESSRTLTEREGVLEAKLATAEHCRRLGITLFSSVMTMRCNYLKVGEIARMFGQLATSLVFAPIAPTRRVPWFLPPFSGMADALKRDVAPRRLRANVQVGGVPLCLDPGLPRTPYRTSHVPVAWTNACAGCADKAHCCGLSAKYLALYGDDEIVKRTLVHRPLELQELRDASAAPEWLDGDCGEGGEPRVGNVLERLLARLLTERPPTGVRIERVLCEHHHSATVELRVGDRPMSLLVALQADAPPSPLLGIGPLVLMLPSGASLDAEARSGLRAMARVLKAALISPQHDWFVDAIRALSARRGRL